MNEKIMKYRKRHKKCKWCKYYKYKTLQQCHWVTCYGECTLKDKIIKFEDIPRICRYYEVKDDKNDRKR